MNRRAIDAYTEVQNLPTGEMPEAWRMPAERTPFWQQIAEEVAEAPLHMQLGVAVFFGAGLGMAIAIFAGWL